MSTGLMPTVTAIDGRPTTTSLDIATNFQKRHADVLRSIQTLGASKSFIERNFALNEYTDTIGRKLPQYQITRDGFSILVMGFTGQKAMQWKEAYIEAFNAMEVELRRQSEAEKIPRLAPAQELAIRMAVTCRVMEQAERRNQHSTYARIYNKLFREFQVNRCGDIPDVDFSAALKYIELCTVGDSQPPQLAPTPPEPPKPTYPTKKMTVHGNAMLGDGIKDGDTVTVRMFEDISPDAIFVVKTPFGPIARRVKNLHGEEVILNASNPQVKDQLWLVKDITLVGVIIGK